MRIFAPTALRAHWRDRAPSVIAESGSVFIAPSATSDVFSYTVPVDRVALIETRYITLLITTAIPAAQNLVSSWRIENAVPALIYEQLHTLGNAEIVGTYQALFGGPIQLPAGFQITCRVQNSAVVGLGFIQAAMTGVEYTL